MASLASIADSDLYPELDPGIYVEPKDRGTDSEYQRQAVFVAAMRRSSPCRVVAIPNGGKRSMWEADKARREGMTAGEPDIAVSWAGALTARIEFKAGKTMPSGAQIDVLNWYHRRGHPVAVCRTRDGALRWLRSLGAPVPEVS